jgi:hypothetical protein
MKVSGQFRVTAALSPGKDLRTDGIGGWVGLSASMDAVNRKILVPIRTRASAYKPVTILNELFIFLN